MSSVDSFLPEPPKITEDILASCRSKNDFRPILFELYKFVGLLCHAITRLRRDSPALTEFTPTNYSVLRGLLNRCTRLMLANVELSHGGLFGETTAIIDRCIFESAVKLTWLCDNDVQRFRQFIADGLKSELELKDNIMKNIETRQEGAIPIEKRMLTSIQNYIMSSGMSEQDIRLEKRLPDLATIVNLTGQERLYYLVGQKLGSHHVHGDWPSLITDYLEEMNGEYKPRGHDSSTNVNQYVFVTLIVLEAIKKFVSCVVSNKEERLALTELIKSVESEIVKINAAVIGNDFESPEI